jgi:predicted AAA+ superfamily ATPase
VPDVLAHTNERALGRSLWSRLLSDEPRRFQLILGPRRVGKTTVMYQTVRHLLDHGVAPQDLWWLGLDHPLLMQESLGDLVRSVIATRRPAADRPVILFLDEIVYAGDWDLWLKTFYDEHWPVRVVATSSATAALRDRQPDSGIGRWQEQYLMPYLYSEFLNLVGVPFDLDVGPTLADTLSRLPRGRPAPPQLAALRRDFLLTGGFPDLLTVRPPEADEQDQLLRSQQALRGDAVERAVYKDIPQSFGLDSPMLLERLLYVLAGQIGGLVSAKSISEQLGGMSQPTFDRYLTYLQRAFLIFTLLNYSGGDGGPQRRGRKVYFVDGAIRNAALQRGLAPLDNPTEMGLLIENLAASTLHSLAVHGGLRLFHWREGRHEVALLLDQPEAPIAFEIGTSADHPRTSLVALMDRHPSLRGRCHLVAPRATTVAPDAHPSGVGTIPLDVFLVAASRQAEAALKNKQS